MCRIIAHLNYNFAHESHGGFPRNLQLRRIMSIIIALLCGFAWLGQALRDGGNIH